MDVKAAKDSLQFVLRKFPREFVLDVAASFARHKDAILAAFPGMIEEVKPHALAAGWDYSMGTLDLPALENAGKELLADFISVDLDVSSLPAIDDEETGVVPE